MARIELTTDQAGRVAHGNPVMLLPDQLLPSAEEALLTQLGKPLAIAMLDGPAAKPARVFNL